MVRIESGIVPSDTGPNSTNFQRWLESLPEEQRTPLEHTRNELAGRNWLARGAPQEGEGGVSVDKSIAEELLTKAYQNGNREALEQILNLWNS